MPVSFYSNKELQLILLNKEIKHEELFIKKLLNLNSLLEITYSDIDEYNSTGVLIIKKECILNTKNQVVDAIKKHRNRLKDRQAELKRINKLESEN